MDSFATTTSGIILFSVILWLWGANRKTTPPFPPGPPGDPILGHARMIPAEHQEEYFAKLGETYGDVIHLKIPGRHFVVLNSIEAATDLLEKRSAIYADRPKIMTLELMGWKRTLPFISAGKPWRTQRRIMQDYLNPRTLEQHQHLQEAEAHVLALNLILRGDQRQRWLERFASSLILSIAYGYRVESDDDQLLKLASHVNYAASHCGSPGANPVDIFPFLRFFPKWFPGAYHANLAGEGREHVESLHELPFKNVQREKAAGIANPSMTLHFLERNALEDGENKFPLIDVRNAAAISFIAGGETTSSVLAFLILAMTVYPECQRKAQKEIDDVIGSERLPTHKDRESLPYISALCQEVLRWRAVAPISMPHQSSAEDIYRGWYIPKGAVLLPNVQAMLWDERTYKDPTVFNPTRFLPKPEGNGEPDPSVVFGFGRRICPGRHLAISNIWIATSVILATMSIFKALDENGEEITPEVKTTSGFTSHPVDFACMIKPRSEAAVALLKQSSH